MVTVGKSQLRVNALEMLRRPGTLRTVRYDVDPSVLDLADERLVADNAVEVDLTCESLSDGIVVRGRITAAFHGECRRCLQPLTGRISPEVHELYQTTVTDPDAFPIENDQIDLAPMIRETVLLELPEGPLCRPDCAGLCARCGADLNEAPCSCPTETVDPRWSALDAIRDELPE